MIATIYDVAKAAGVSIATVSAVVNDSAFVSDRLAIRVRTAISTLAYEPNLLARGLASQLTRTLGIVVPDMTDPFFSEVARAVEDAARAVGCSLLVGSSDNEPRQEEAHLRLFLARRVDGVLLTKAPGPMPKSLVKTFAKARVPIVLIGQAVHGLNCDVVELDDRAVSYDGVTHLLRLGYRRIGILAGTTVPGATKRCLEGYRAALRDSNVVECRGLVAEGRFDTESGYRAGLELLKHQPDAVFVTTYRMSIGLMESLKRYRLRCPEDVAIVSGDDHPSLKAFSPELTAIELPKRELGATAAGILFDRLARRRRGARTVRLTGTIRVRESCGCALRGQSIIGRERQGGAGSSARENPARKLSQEH